MSKRVIMASVAAFTVLLGGAGCSRPAPAVVAPVEPTPQLPIEEKKMNIIDEDADVKMPENTTSTADSTEKKPTSTVKVETEKKVVTPPPAPVATVKTFTVTGNNFAFDVKTMTVKQGDKVRVTFKNVEGFHDWKLDEFNIATQRMGAGKEETVEFTADKKGTFEYYCSVGSHRAMGMKGTLTVE